MVDSGLSTAESANSTPVSPGAGANTVAVVYARLPVPPMSNTNIEAWFTTMDFWFTASGITTDKQKTATILAALDPNVIAQLGDVIASLPQNDRFEFVKQKIIDHFADSEQRRLNRLLSELPLGDKKPSELYYEMKRVAGSTLGEAALKGLWTKRLPELAQPVVAASSGTAAEFTKIADSIVDAIAPSHINKVETTQPNEIEGLRVAINELSKKFDKLRSRSRSRNRRQSNFHPRSRSRNRSQAAGTSTGALDECWYHKRYGRDARKCRSPCQRQNRSTVATVANSSSA